MRGIADLLARRTPLVLLLALGCGGRIVWAGSDYSDKDFSLRLAPAFLRFTEVSAVGGETVANRFSSAINPASAGWLALPQKLGLVAAPYYSHVCLDSGTRLHIVGESLTWDTRKWGTIQPTLSQVRSNHDVHRLGLEFDYRVDTVQVQWAKRFGQWGLGAMFNFAEAEIVQKLGAVRMAEGHAESYRFRLGGLVEPADKWLLGLMVEYGLHPWRSSTRVLGAQGFTTVRMDGTQNQLLLRPGISYEYAKLSVVFLDYQYGSFFNQFGCLQHHRVSAGVDHRVLDWLFVRAGASFDARGNMGWTCGASVQLAEWCGIDFGYQYDVLPELRPEFGRSHTLQLTFSARF